MKLAIKRLSLLLTVVGVSMLTMGSSPLCNTGVGIHESNSLFRRANPRFVPHWSPNGDYLVFARGGSDRADIYVVKSDGSELLMVSDREGQRERWYDFSPDFSPDGTRIVYATYGHNVDSRGEKLRIRNLDIETVGVDGSDRRRLTDDIDAEESPVWSPDGSHIAFISHYSYDKEPGIYTMAPDGSDQRLVVRFRSITNDEDPATDLYSRLLGGRGPVWSPDGKKLAYVLGVQERNPNRQRGHKDSNGQVLYTVNADGTALKELFAVEDSLKESITTEPVWSPDSQRIAFVHQTQPTEGNQGMVKLYTVRPDGSELTQILGPDQGFLGLGHSGVLSWSPDGTRILLSRTRYTVLGPLSIINADGTDWEVIGGTGAHAVWSLDGTKIATLNDLEYTESDPSIFLSTINRDGTDLQVLVRIDEEGNLTAGNPQK